METIKNITNEDLSDIKMIVLDVDGVLVPRGSIIEQEGNRTMFVTKRIRDSEIEYIKKLSELGYHINISSGRSLFMLMDMFREVLPYVSITYENGSCTYYRGDIIQHSNTFEELTDIRKELEKVQDKRIKGWEPKEHIITIHATSRIQEIEDVTERLKNVQSLWNGEAYDIMPKGHSKARGLKEYRKYRGLKKEHVLAIGDNYNDKELLDESGISISADKSRVVGDFFIPMPAGVMMESIIENSEDDKND